MPYDLVIFDCDDEDPSALLDAGAIVFDSMQKLPWLLGFD